MNETKSQRDSSTLGISACLNRIFVGNRTKACSSVEGRCEWCCEGIEFSVERSCNKKRTGLTFQFRRGRDQLRLIFFLATWKEVNRKKLLGEKSKFKVHLPGLTEVLEDSAPAEQGGGWDHHVEKVRREASQ